MLMWLLWQNYLNQEVHEDVEIQIVPTNIFVLQKQDKKQSSLVTIFSIWNITLGSSILSIPWAISKAGLLAGIIAVAVMNALMLYTCYLIIYSVKHCGKPDNVNDFPDVCREFLSVWGYRISMTISIFTLMSAAIVLWILLSNFMYSTIFYIYELQNRNDTAVQRHAQVPFNRNPYGLLCPALQNATILAEDNLKKRQNTIFFEIWDKTKTVPFFALAIIFPLSCLKSPTFFVKFNSLGTLASVYLVGFVIWRATNWGLHWDVQNVSLVQFTFPSLTGLISLAFFTHNGILSILKCQRHPENNVRDLVIAYICSGITYLAVGLAFYLSFPLPKDRCIESVFLDNFPADDVLSFLGRFGFMLQIIAVFPLIMYILRAQFMYMIYRSLYPSFKHILIWNCLVTAICVLFARFFPNVGTILRYSGAFGSLFYCFTLPCIVTIAIKRKEDRLSWPMTVFFGVIMMFGVANFFAQFFI